MITKDTNLKIAIIGSGPAGIYASDLILKNSDNFRYKKIEIDIFESLPTPYGLVRYGVSPDHPRIKKIIDSLYKILNNKKIRFFGNVTYGKDILLNDLQSFYNIIIFATGASKDAKLVIPGVNLLGSFGASDFISWYNGNPNYSNTWDLSAKKIAIIGNGNVAIDITRILSKQAEDLRDTEIPDHVYQELKSSSLQDIHIFGRRDITFSKFTPLELKNLNSIKNLNIFTYSKDFILNKQSLDRIQADNRIKNIFNIFKSWLIKDKAQSSNFEKNNSNKRNLHFHFSWSPQKIYGQSKVNGVVFQKTCYSDSQQLKFIKNKNLKFSAQAVYRAIGYLGSKILDVEFDSSSGVILNKKGRVLDKNGKPIKGLYTTGWIKRGPIGLIGNTKSDAKETINCMLEDQSCFRNNIRFQDSKLIYNFFEKNNIKYITWNGWLKVDNYEIKLGRLSQKNRTKLVDKTKILSIANKK